MKVGALCVKKEGVLFDTPSSFYAKSEERKTKGETADSLPARLEHQAHQQEVHQFAYQDAEGHGQLEGGTNAA